MSGEAARLYITVGANTGPAVRGLTSLNGTLTGVAKNAAKTIAVVTGIATVTKGIEKAAQVTIDFDKSMRNVNSIAHLNERQFQRLSTSVRKLGAQTAQSPRTLAEGLYDLVSSGFDAQESLLILKSSAKAATAGLTDTAVSTKAVAAVLNAYHRPASDAAKVSDDLFQTVNRGVLSFEDLAQNIGDVLPWAAQLHVGLKQVGAAVATTTKQGESAPEALTKIKGAMVALVKPSEDLQKAYKQLGVTSGGELIQKTGSFQDALQALWQVTGQNATAFQKLFPDIRGGAGALELVGKNARTAKADLKAFADDSGITNKTLAEQAKSVAYQWNKVKAMVVSATIGIGSKAIPVVFKGLQAAQKFFSELQSGKGTGGQVGGAIADGLGKAEDALSGLLDRLDQGAHLGEIFDGLQPAAEDVRDIAAALERGAGAAAHFADQSGVIQGLGRVLAGGFNAAKGAVHTFASLLRGDLGGAVEGLKTTFSGITEVIVSPFRVAMSAILGIVSGGLSGVASLVGKLSGLPIIGGKFKGMANGLRDAADEINQLRQSIAGIGAEPKKIEISADAKAAAAELKKIQGTEIGDKIVHVLGDKKDADAKLKALIAMGIPPKKATVLANVGDALRGLSTVDQALARINGSIATATIRIEQEGTASIPRLTPHPQGNSRNTPTAPSNKTTNNSRSFATGGTLRDRIFGMQYGGGFGSLSHGVATKKPKDPPVTDVNPDNGNIETHPRSWWKKKGLSQKSAARKKRIAKARQKAADRKFQGGFDRFDQLMSKENVAVQAAALTEGAADDIAAISKVQASRAKRVKTLQGQLKQKVHGHYKYRGKKRQQINDALVGLLSDTKAGRDQLAELAKSTAPTEGDRASLAVLQASLNPGDLQGQQRAASRLVDVRAAEYQAALGTGDFEKISEAAQNLQAADDQLKDAAQALRDAAESAKDAQFSKDDAALIAAKIATPNDTSDDLRALNASLQDATAYYQQAVAAGDVEGQIKWGQALLDARSSIDDLTSAVNDLNQTMIDLYKQQADIANRNAAVSNADLRALKTWIAGITNGQIGSTVGLRRGTPAPLTGVSR